MERDYCTRHGKKQYDIKEMEWVCFECIKEKELSKEQKSSLDPPNLRRAACCDTCEHSRTTKNEWLITCTEYDKLLYFAKVCDNYKERK